MAALAAILPARLELIGTTMRFNDAVIGIVIIVFAAATILYTRTFPEMPGQQYGPALFPILISGGMIACGVLLIWRGVRSGDARITLGPWAANGHQVINLALVPGALIFYVLASDFLGFVIAAMIILMVLLLRFGAAVRTALAVTPTATLLIHTVFVKFLLVPLPWGLLLPVAW